jgi:hypothetical protein
MDPFPLQWRLYNHNIHNSNLWSIKYNVYADQHRHVTKKTTDSSYVYYDRSGATVGDRGSMAWMLAYKAVSNLRSIKSMIVYRIVLYRCVLYTLCRAVIPSLSCIAASAPCFNRIRITST